jgi:hypothetical protein
METIVVGYDGTRGADSCVRILEREHRRVAAQLERAGVHVNQQE